MHELQGEQKATTHSLYGKPGLDGRRWVLLTWTVWYSPESLATVMYIPLSYPLSLYKPSRLAPAWILLVIPSSETFGDVCRDSIGLKSTPSGTSCLDSQSRVSTSVLCRLCSNWFPHPVHGFFCSEDIEGSEDLNYCQIPRWPTAGPRWHSKEPCDVPQIQAQSSTAHNPWLLYRIKPDHRAQFSQCHLSTSATPHPWSGPTNTSLFFYLFLSFTSPAFVHTILFWGFCCCCLVFFSPPNPCVPDNWPLANELWPLNPGLLSCVHGRAVDNVCY